MNFQMDEGEVSKLDKIAFFSENRINRNIQLLKKANLRSHFETKERDNSTLNSNRLSLSCVLPAYESLKHRHAEKEENRQANCVNQSKVIYKKIFQPPFKNIRKRLANPKLSSCASDNKSSIILPKLQGQESITKADSNEIRVFNSVFHRKLTSVLNVEQIRSLVRNDPSIFTNVKKPILTEKSIFKTLEAFISKSDENKKILDVKDKIYFLKGIADYLLPKAKNVLSKECYRNRSSITKNTNSNQVDLENYLRLFNQLHSKRNFDSLVK